MSKKKSKLRKWMIIGIIAVVVIGAVGSFLAKPAPSKYESVTAKIGDITNYYSFTGNIESKNRQTLMSDNIMQISDLRVEEGDIVEEGDVLIKTTAGSKLKAKIDGEVANLDVEEDQQVMSGTKLLEVVDYNTLQVTVKVDEYDLAAVKKGKETTVKIVALDKEVKGKISSISKEGQVENGITYFTSIINLNKDTSLRIGMSTEVKLLNDKVLGVVTLPMSAIQFDDNNKPYVFKKGKDGEPIKTEITTGINDGITIEIKKGVSKGETILYTKAGTSENPGFMGRDGNEQASGGGANQ